MPAGIGKTVLCRPDATTLERRRAVKCLLLLMATAPAGWLVPIVGKNYEAGIKGEYFDGALNASTAVFLLDQKNRAKRLTDQSGGISYPSTVCYEAAGEVSQ